MSLPPPNIDPTFLAVGTVAIMTYDKKKIACFYILVIYTKTLGITISIYLFLHDIFVVIFCERCECLITLVKRKLHFTVF